MRVKSSDPNQRPFCGCVRSVDIGSYNCCSHGCIYCYANHSTAAENRKKHRPESELLIGELAGEDMVRDRL